MVETTQDVITETWKQVSFGNCTVQSETRGVLYDVGVGEVEPVAGQLVVNMDQPSNFVYESPIWLRLHSKGAASYQCLVSVVKEVAE